MNAKTILETVQHFFAGLSVDEHSVLLVTLGMVGGLLLGGRSRVHSAVRRHFRRWGRGGY